MLKFRNAEKKDIKFILDSFSQIKVVHSEKEKTRATAERLEEDLFSENPKAWVLIAEKDSKPIGLALYSTLYYSDEGQLMWVSEFYINSENRGLGIFPKMLEKLETIAKKNNYAYIGWAALPENEHAIRLYEKAVNKDGLNTVLFHKKVK